MSKGRVGTETYAAARQRVHRELGLRGWKTSPPTLKLPHATSPDGQVRLWFKPQAVYHTTGDRHEAGNARTVSYDFDIRGMPVEAVVEVARKLGEER